MADTASVYMGQIEGVEEGVVGVYAERAFTLFKLLPQFFQEKALSENQKNNKKAFARKR